MLGTARQIGMRPLGRTGLTVSEVSLGTVELGLDYGINVPGQYGCPLECDAIQILHRALDSGITLFDTAPTYGNSEEVVGKALGNRRESILATKFTIPRHENGELWRGRNLTKALMTSIHTSRTALRRTTIDILQVHNATCEIIHCDELWETLVRSKCEGSLRCIGASVYTEEEALQVMGLECCDVLQVPFNLLDQRMSSRVFSAASEAGLGLLTRSAFLKGALTYRAQWLPPELQELKQAVERIRSTFKVSWEGLPQLALRFCLSARSVSSILVGVRNQEELDVVFQGVHAEHLSDEERHLGASLGLNEDRLLNPTHWEMT